MLLSKLQARYQQVHDQEPATAWLPEHDALKRERDALAEEVREVYPEAANKIVDLFVRIANNNKALSELHQARPAGVMEHLISAELHARGLIASLATRLHFSLRCACSISTVAVKSGRRRGRQYQRRSPHP